MESDWRGDDMMKQTERKKIEAFKSLCGLRQLLYVYTRVVAAHTYVMNIYAGI